MLADRGWRGHALDGAALLFHPRTGASVRIDAPETRKLRRRAPRVLLFGITNRCNLACGFCSRDADAPSAWTVDSAFDVLSGLSERGVLEVAFGGGEPLAFRGFDLLVERLSTETELAVHFTTNGTLLTEARLARLTPHVGEIRLSVYDDQPWEPVVVRLAASGVRFGVNLLVTRPRARAIASILARLSDLGCADVALLRYVGPDPAMHLRAADERALADGIGAATPSGMRVRLSVCFGDRLHLPRLWGEGDCGAGLDFAVVGPDRSLKACSFGGAVADVHTASDVLTAWQARREALLAPSIREGCARAEPSVRVPPLEDGVRIWRSFSANNSGDCVLVGRFETVAEADRYLGDLEAGFEPGRSFGDAWCDLLRAEKIAVGDEVMPDAMARMGKNVLVYTEQTLADDFPSLRALVWRRGGRVVANAIHNHRTTALVFGVTFSDEAARERAEASRFGGLGDADMPVARRGDALFGIARTRGDQSHPMSVHGLVLALERVVGVRSVAAELLPGDTFDLAHALSVRADVASVARFWARFPTPEAAAGFASGLGGEGAAVVAGRYLLIEAREIRPRLGARAIAASGVGEVVRARRLRIVARCRPVAASVLGPTVRGALGRSDTMAVEERPHDVGVVIETDAPLAVLRSLAGLHATGVLMSIDLTPIEPLASVLARLQDDLDGG